MEKYKELKKWRCWDCNDILSHDESKTRYSSTLLNALEENYLYWFCRCCAFASSYIFPLDAFIIAMALTLTLTLRSDWVCLCIRLCIRRWCRWWWWWRRRCRKIDWQSRRYSAIRFIQWQDQYGNITKNKYVSMKHIEATDQPKLSFRESTDSQRNM